MTGPYDNPDSRPISVAELLARSGTVGAPPPGGRRRRRRGDTDSVTVAELTGEIPVVRTGEIPIVEDEELEKEQVEHDEAPYLPPMNGTADRIAEPTTAPKPALYREAAEEAYDYEPELDDFMDSIRGPARARRGRAEQMTPDAVDEVDDGLAAPSRDPDDLPSYLRGEREHLFGGSDTDLVTEAPTAEDEAAAAEPFAGMGKALRGGWIVLQSIIAVAFGAGLFMGFDQLWKWNNIVALVLSVLVILGLVVAVRIVRKTEDIASTLIAVAVGALVTLGPLALLQSN